MGLTGPGARSQDVKPESARTFQYLRPALPKPDGADLRCRASSPVQVWAGPGLGQFASGRPGDPNFTWPMPTLVRERYRLIAWGKAWSSHIQRLQYKCYAIMDLGIDKEPCRKRCETIFTDAPCIVNEVVSSILYVMGSQ